MSGILPRYNTTFSVVTPDLFPHSFHNMRLTISTLNRIEAVLGGRILP